MKSKTHFPNNSSNSLDRVVPPAEAAILLGMQSRTTYWRWRIAGKLPPAIVVDGKCLGHRESAIHQWLEDHTV